MALANQLEIEPVGCRSQEPGSRDLYERPVARGEREREEGRREGEGGQMPLGAEPKYLDEKNYEMGLLWETDKKEKRRRRRRDERERGVRIYGDRGREMDPKVAK